MAKEESSEQLYLVYDYETRSKANLKRQGGYEYARHPSTEILCCAYRLGTRKTIATAPTKLVTREDVHAGTKDVYELLHAFLMPSVKLVAHNAFFEHVITKYVFRVKGKKSEALDQALKPERFICTAAQAAALALPRDLEGAGAALGLKVQKDMAGHRLMLRYSKPRKATKNDDSEWHYDLEGLQRLYDYCKTDIAVEVDLFLKLPFLTPQEQLIWQLDQTINLRGFTVDRPMVTQVLAMIELESARLLKRCAKITDGAVRSPKQRDATLAWLEEQGCMLPDLRAGTVAEAIKEGLATGPARLLLKTRQALSKSSTAKYASLEASTRTDGRCRDILLYHAASTGRWGGRRVQPQNFPRPKIKNTLHAAEVLAEGDIEMVRLLFGSPMEVFSSCLRNTIVAPRGHTLDVADYAAIEARVLFWVAKHESGLQAFREGRDLYVEQAADVFAKKAAEIDKDSFERFIGKGLILGCGYGMGDAKFQATCLAQGREVTEELAQRAVAAYRERHWPVPKLWKMLEAAARAAVENVGKSYTVNRTTWYRDKRFLYCKLPSGRRLAYAEPTIRMVRPVWGGDPRPTLFHYGVDSMSKKWREQKTWGGTLTENVVQAIARDLMADAMLRIEKAGWQIVLSVHDELIAEVPVFRGDLTHERFEALMAELPPWCEDAPIAVDGWRGPRYRK